MIETLQSFRCDSKSRDEKEILILNIFTSIFFQFVFAENRTLVVDYFLRILTKSDIKILVFFQFSSVNTPVSEKQCP